MLFSNYERTDASRKRNRESEFAFLDRSSRPEIAQVRGLLEAYAGRYPQGEMADLSGRIQSGNDRNFHSAAFELALYVALTNLGFKLTPHPTLDNGVQFRPDFLAVCPNGEEFYLEAALASEDKGQEPGASARKGMVYDALASVAHPNFLVGIDESGAPKSQPPSSALRSATLNWLDGLNADEAWAAWQAEKETPEFLWTHEDWHLTLRAIPVSPERRGKTKSLIGVLGGDAGWVDGWSPIRDAVKFKGSKYGETNKAFVVAINVNAFHLDPIDEMQALFGQEQYVFKAGQEEPEFQRIANGAWNGPKGPQYTRVSGAWLFNDLTPYTLTKRRSTLYVNPWAQLAVPKSLLVFPHAIAQDDELHTHEGISIGKALDLAEGWPEVGE